MKTKTYVVTAALAAISVLAKDLGVPRADVAFSLFVSPEQFEPAGLIALFIVGQLMIASTPRPSIAKAVVQRLHDSCLVGFAGIAGGIAGWGIMASVLHVIAEGVGQLPAAVALGGTAVILTAAPLRIYEEVQPVFAEYSSFRLGQRRGLFTFQLAGWATSIVSATGFISWWLKG